ncbi:MAG: hypothetical protein JW795_17410 [Chitinivibrionales bacterium]|nr:hypothetical protein [Chitinivibrionales bacterium]
MVRAVKSLLCMELNVKREVERTGAAEPPPEGGRENQKKAMVFVVLSLMIRYFFILLLTTAASLFAVVGREGMPVHVVYRTWYNRLI